MDNLTTSSLTELRVITIAIKDNYLWVIMALGFPGNLLTFFTILSIRPRLRFTVYVAALAVVDNVCLVTKVININLNQRHVNMGDFGCQFLQYWGSLTGQWANWLLVMMTAERLIDITMPLLSMRINKRIYLSLNGIIILSLLAINWYYFKVFYFNKGDNNKCDYHNETKEEENFYFIAVIIHLIVYSFLPVLLILIMTCLIAKRLYASVSNLKRHFSVSRSALEKRKRFQRQITIMTMFTCVVFSILVIPRPVQHLFMADFKRRKVPYDENLQFFLTNIFFVMSDSSHAVNFYIYFLSNKFFRKQLYEKLNNLIKGIKTCPAQSPQFSNLHGRYTPQFSSLHGRYTRSSWTKQTAI
ncbi:rhodopsin [Biomphalaria glabrata]|nr:rhodopsin [Biomphalaria glabrata]